MTGHNPRGSCPVAFNRANFAEFVLSLVNQSTDFPRQSKTLRARGITPNNFNMFQKKEGEREREREREREKEREEGQRTEVDPSILRKLRGKTAGPRGKKKKKKKEKRKKKNYYVPNDAPKQN